MKKIFTLFLLLFSLEGSAQELHINWNRFIGGDGSCPAQVRHSITTSDKGILFTGITTCNDKGDMPPFTISGMNAFIGKLDSNQQLSWIKTVGGNDEDYGDILFEFPNGDIAWGQTTTSNTFPGYHGGSEVLLMRLDGYGNILSQKCYGSIYAESINSAIPTGENGMVTFAFSGGDGGDVPAHYGNLEFWYDWWVFKTDSSGNIIWSKNFGGSEDESGFGSILDIADNYYVFASTKSKDFDCTDTSWHSASVNTGSDFYLMKLDTAGNLLWSKSYGGAAFENAGRAIFDERDSTIVFTGESWSYDNTSTGNHGLADVAIVKVDLDGNVIWHTMLGYVSEELGKSSICKARDKGYIVLANTYNGMIGAQDGLLAYIDSAGAIISEKIFGSIINESSASVHPYLNGFIATGSAGKPEFAEGTNIGHAGEAPAAFSYFTYFDYWPLGTADMNHNRENPLTIYPNPAEDRVYIKTDGKPLQIKVLDLLGNKVYESNHPGGESIDVSSWARGVYYLYTRSNQGPAICTKLLLP